MKKLLKKVAIYLFPDARFWRDDFWMIIPSGVIFILFMSIILITADIHNENISIQDEFDFCTSNEGYIDYVDSKDGWIYFCNEPTYRIN